jgi:hypothetical protein
VSATPRWHGYATFGFDQATSPHPTLPPHVAHPSAIIEIWAPNQQMARDLVHGLTGGVYSDLHQWPTTEVGIALHDRYYDRGVSMVVEVTVTASAS